MTTRRTRRAARSARTARSAGLVALAAAAALALSACQGDSGDEGAAPAKQDSASHATGDGGTSGGTGGSGAGKTPNGEQGGTPTEGRTAAPSGTAAKGTPSRTQKLVDGSTAKIYALGGQRHRAEIVNGGDLLATLETGEHDAGLDANGMYVVLTMGGDVRSWMGGEHQGPGTFRLAGGWKAKVTKAGEGRYRAQILGHDGEVALLDADQRDTGVVANGIYIVLSSGGVISSHE
ncbi:hypothetical protein [Streptomyces sp. SCSIO ZS0520]|uniref:hypothetical protein n=1 Tax=Streptomyces sp. SCSIO ZS0520 TaxID=2892996 RepID=UPI0021DA300E|nr:hypothetical protein [Streptomyces sp. SCSIO ZS0520]